MSLRKLFNLKANKRLDFNPAQHLFDETRASSGGVWVNLHGYLNHDGTYYIGADYRWMGIRVQNVIVNCGKNYDAYNYWLREVGVKQTERFHEKVRDNLPHTTKETDTCFVFHTIDGKEKSYNVDESCDVYAWID